jgi:phosphatidylglycerophosphatase A
MGLTKAGPAGLGAPHWATLVATCFGLGRLGPAPGTWGSLAAILLWPVLALGIPNEWQSAVLAVLTVLSIAVGVPAASRVARACDCKDPPVVIIDEVAGQWTSLLFAPVSWKTLLLGFILFRGFDIWKPPPVRQLERLPEGWGIVADDVGAGLYALGVIEVVRHLGVFSGWL